MRRTLAREKTGTQRPHVVVLGGGFGGLAAVHALRNVPVDVTLVDRQAYNTFQPLLYQVATAGLNPGDITYFLRSVHARQSNMRFNKGRAASVDPVSRSVRLEGGTALDYDYLVVATGVTTNYFGVPGAEEHALALYTRDQALAVRDRMFSGLERAVRRGQPDDLRVVVVGGGATGVEMAGTLAELRNSGLATLYPELDADRTHITLVEMAPEVLAPFGSRAKRYTTRALRSRGVQLRLGTTVTEVRSDGVVVDGGEFIPAGLVIWASGVKVPEELAGWGLPRGDGGRIEVGADLRVRGFDDVFAVGDIAAGPAPLPQLAQPALQGGRHAGRQIARLVAGEDTKPFSYFDKGIMATIGRSSAVAEVAHLPTITGFPAWVAWLGVHVFSLLSSRNRVATMVNLGSRYLSWPRSYNAIVGEVRTPEDGRIGDRQAHGRLRAG